LPAVLITIGGSATGTSTSIVSGSIAVSALVHGNSGFNLRDD